MPGKSVRILLLLWCLLAGSMLPAGAVGHSPVAADNTHSASSTLRDESHHSDAVLTDTTQLLRVCGQRSSRLLPTAIKIKRPAQRQNILFNHHYLPFRHYGNRLFGETGAIKPMPQCDYFVFALRHLLC